VNLVEGAIGALWWLPSGRGP